MNQGMMNPNNGEIFPQNHQLINQSNQSQKFPLEYILYICLGIAVIGCFLPFATFSESIYGTKATTNYIVYENNYKDGIFIILIAASIFFAVFKKKNYISPLILSIIGIAITIFDMIDVKNSYERSIVNTYLKDYVSYNYGIGAYIVLIALIGALIVSLMLYKNNKSIIRNTPSVVPQPAMNVQNNIAQPIGNQFVQPIQIAKCQYCGSVKNEGEYCKNCGSKYVNS